MSKNFDHVKEFNSSQDKYYGNNRSTLAGIAAQSPYSGADPTPKYDGVVVLGRFQPLHDAHIELIDEAFKLGKKVLIVVGSAFDAPTSRNPLSFGFRAGCLEAHYSKELATGRLEIAGLEDYTYRDDKWYEEFTKLVKSKLPSNMIWLSCKKDAETSKYVEDTRIKFVRGYITPKSDINATDIRYKFFSGAPISTLDHTTADVKVRLDAYRLTDDYTRFVAEQKATEGYKASWASAPFPPIFVAVDALVEWRDHWSKPHILLIKRKSDFGNGRIALPGGYLDPNEYVIDGAKRELLEETSLTVDDTFQLLKAEMFDKPDRSTRGRMITHCHNWVVHSKFAPAVLGGDDAAEAFWMPIDEIYENKRNFFSDHYYIISKMIHGIEDFKR